MKMIVVIIAIVLMLAGGAFAVMKTMQIGFFAPDSETDDKSAEAGVEGPQAPKLAMLRTVPMDALLIPIFRGGKAVTSIQISLELEAASADNEAKITKLLPRLSDAFLRDLYS